MALKKIHCIFKLGFYQDKVYFLVKKIFLQAQTSEKYVLVVVVIRRKLKSEKGKKNIANRRVLQVFQVTVNAY